MRQPGLRHNQCIHGALVDALLFLNPGVDGQGKVADLTLDKVLDRLIFIGSTIDQTIVRERLKKANAESRVARRELDGPKGSR